MGTVQGIVITRHGDAVAMLELLDGMTFTKREAHKVARKLSRVLVEVIGGCTCPEHLRNGAER